MQPRQAKDLWKTIRRSLPKFQQRRLNAPPEQIEALEEEWHPYFQHLEAGSFVEADELVQACCDFQSTHGGVQTECGIHDVPSIQMLENMFRCTQSRKSTGLDPIASGFFHSFPAETAQLFFELVFKNLPVAS